jgi:C1A family cysteine protease
MPEHGFGWRRDRPDHRDYLLHERVRLPLAGMLPIAVDLRLSEHLDDPIFDQGQIGSCTANAIASALQFVERATGLTADVTPSRLALYYWERVLEGSVDEDVGAELRDGLKVVAGLPGYVDESLWPYHVGRFAEAPPPPVVAAAARNRATRYMRVVVSAASMKQALAAGFPVIVGFDVFEPMVSDQVARTGILPRPFSGQQPIGGHAVLLVGYDDAARVWICRNSWGSDWGRDGYFTVPYGYLDSPAYAADFWVIEQEVEGVEPAPAPAADPLRELAGLLRRFITEISAWLRRHGL